MLSYACYCSVLFGGCSYIFLISFIFNIPIGYMFDNKEEIKPHMEDERGPTFEFCKEMALKHKSFVVAGYPRLQSMHCGDRGWR